MEAHINLKNAMSQEQSKSRIHLLAAKSATTLVILQRKRAKLFHVTTVDTETNQIEEGSWFHGKLYPLRCDVSFDGKFMVYLAIGSNGNTWNGICRLPWLTTMIDAGNLGTWFGGGYFEAPRLLRSNGWRRLTKRITQADVPFAIEPYASRHGGEDLGVIYQRFERDGFTRNGDLWTRKFSRCHPELQAHYLGYFQNTNGWKPTGYTFAFSLDEHPSLLESATWATWDMNGNLWVARPGVVEKFTLDGLRRGKPSFSIDADRFDPSLRKALVATKRSKKAD